MTNPHTLEGWIDRYAVYAPMRDHAPAIGIQDTVGIDHTRTWLFDLDDYVVSSVSGGVIWLTPRQAAQ